MISNSDVIKKLIESQKVNIVPDSDFYNNITANERTESFIRNLSNAIIKEHVIVPVICEDMFEYTNPQTGETQTLHSYLVQTIIDKCIEPINLTTSKIEDIMKDEFYGMRLLENIINDNFVNETFHQILFNAIDNNVHLKNEVKDF